MDTPTICTCKTYSHLPRNRVVSSLVSEYKHVKPADIKITSQANSPRNFSRCTSLNPINIASSACLSKCCSSSSAQQTRHPFSKLESYQLNGSCVCKRPKLIALSRTHRNKNTAGKLKIPPPPPCNSKQIRQPRPL
jgi:hypothetical protein